MNIYNWYIIFNIFFNISIKKIKPSNLPLNSALENVICWFIESQMKISGGIN